VSESLFTTQTPAITDQTDGIGYALATRIRPTVAGTVTHGRWFFPATNPSSAPKFGLYRRTSDASGALLGSATWVSWTPGAWGTVALASPVSVTAGDDLYAVIWTPDRYVATSAFFGADVTNGNLTGPANSSTGPARNGRYYSNATDLQYPVDGGGSCYFADLVFEPATTGITATAALTAPAATATATAALPQGVLTAALTAPHASATATLANSTGGAISAIGVIAAPRAGATGAITITTPVPAAGGWASLQGILDTNRRQAGDYAMRALVDCPRDGTPLDQHPDISILHCPHCGATWRG